VVYDGALPTSAPDHESRLALGLVPGQDARSSFARRYDRREDYDGGALSSAGPSTWATETPKGLELRRHPLVESLDPRYDVAVDVLGRYRAGLGLELTSVEVEGWSGYELDCWAVIRGAHYREEARRVRERGSAGGAS